MRLIEIIAVTISVLILLGTGVVAARAGLAFKRTFSIFRGKAEPKVYILINGGEVAQSRAFEVVDKLGLLQMRVESARVTLFRMLTLGGISRDVWAKVAPVFAYVGL